MQNKILARLRQIASEENVTILHAVESGSRAWGFASADSDYDVRFLYVRPARWYLQLGKIRDVLEYPVDEVWDVNGWDLQKALRLMHSSNPTLFEWLGSPVVYLTTPFAEELRAAGQACYRKRAGLHHYLNMARGDLQKHLRDETVEAKKYFYALRPALACRWILENETPPPVAFGDLCDSELPAALRPAVEQLLEWKQILPESGRIARLPELDRFLEESLAETERETAALPKEPDPDWGPLDALFLRAAGWEEGLA